MVGSKKNNSSVHCFSVELAKDVGMEKAAIIHHIRFWLKKNGANEHNINDGKSWTHQTARQVAEALPYLKEKSISRWLGELVKGGYLLATDQYNKTKYDRTMWYAIGPAIESNANYYNDENSTSQDEEPAPRKEESIAQNEELKDQNEELTPQTEELSDQNENSLKGADSTPDSTPDSKPCEILADDFESARRKYPGVKRGHDTELRELQRHKDWRIVVPKLLPAIQREMEHKAALKSAGEFVPSWKHFKTWISNRCWEQEFADPVGPTEVDGEVHFPINPPTEAQMAMLDEMFGQVGSQC